GSGAVLKTVGASPNPGTGLMSSNPSYGFVAPATGTYYAKVVASNLTATQSSPFTLDLHRLALAHGAQDVATLSQTGSMFAWLSGNTLNISGPTGYGFGITGNWAQTAIASGNGRFASTYVATGDVQLQTAAGPLTLSGTSFTVTTAPQINGRVFGVI